VGPTASEPRPCGIAGWSDGDIAVTCVADRPAWAAVSSSAAPGWTVTVDDRAADWLPADVLRRAVAIPAGSHRIHWRYATPGLAIGAWIAAAGLAALLAIAAAWIAGPALRRRGGRREGSRTASGELVS
jgi:hypothetical protein